MRKLTIVLLLLTTLSLQGCAYELGYLVGTGVAYGGAAVAVSQF